MSVERVKNYLKAWGLGDRVLEFQQSTATVALAAAALHVEVGRIAKTLALEAPDGCMLLLAPGDRRLDNRKFKAQFGKRPKMLSHERAHEFTRYQVGAVCPFDIPGDIPIYMDKSLQRFQTVYPACGSANSCIELSPERLIEVCGIKGVIDVMTDE